MTRDTTLAARLVDVIDTWRVPIDARCRALLVQFVEGGVARFAAEGADEARCDEAVDRLRLLLGDMTQQIRIQRFDALHDLNFLSAVDRLRPLWPFC